MPINRSIGVNLAFTADTKQVQQQLNALQNSLTKLINSAPSSGFSGFTKELQTATQAAATLKVQLENATNVNTGKLDLGKFQQSLKTSGMTLADYKVQLANLGPQGVAAFGQLSQAIMNAEMPLRRSSQLLTDFATTLKNTARWQISSSLLHGFMGSIQTAYHYAQDLNESLNNIRIVTNKNVDEMAQFAKEANSAAQALNTTTTAYTDASLIYYQQGLSDEEVKARTDVTVKMANVTRESATEVSEQMTAIWNNFAKGSENLEYYSDVITALGAATASSSAEISEGLEKFAAVADTVGLSYEYATSALATVTATTRQSADIVGNAFKTLFSRIQGLKLGETLDDGTDLNKYSAALEAVGVNIKGVDGELKDMDVILDELGAKWRTLEKDQKMALAQTVAGVRQYTQLIALMDNWDFFQDNLAIAKDSEGTLQEQADIYAESWEAASKRVKSAAEQIYNDLLNDKFFIDLNNSLAKTLGFVDQLIKGFGGVQGILLGTGNLIFKLYGTQLSEGINNVIYGLQMMSASGRDAIKQTKNEVNDLLQSFYQNSNNPYLKAIGEAYAQQGNAQNELIKQSEKLDETQRKIAAVLLDQQKILTENVIKQAELAEQADKQFKNVQKMTIVDASAGRDDATKKQIRDNVKIYSEEMKKFGHFNSATENFIGDINLDKMTAGVASKEAVKEVENLKNGITSLVNQYSNVSNSLTVVQRDFSKAFGKEAAEDLKILWSTLKQVDLNNLTDTELTNIINQLTTVRDRADELSNRGQQASNILERLNIDTEELSNNAYQAGVAEGNLNDSLSRSSAGADNFANRLSNLVSTMQNAGETVVQFAQATTNAAMTATMFSSMLNTLGDSSVSLAQKTTSVGMAVGKLSSTIITGVNAFKKAKEASDKLAMATNIYMIALTVIITTLQVVINKINEKREALIESNKAIIDATNAERENAKANKELYNSFNDLYSRYKEGADVKDDLYGITNQLLEAYDLEGSRLDMLTGKYDQVAIAIKNKQKAEQEEILKQDKKAIKAAGENVVEQGRTVFDSGIHGDQYRVRLSGNSIIKGEEGDYNQAISAAKEIFGESAISSNDFSFTLNDLYFDPKNTKEISDFIFKLEQFSDALEKAGYEGSYFYDNLKKKIDAFNQDGALDSLRDLQKETLNDLLNNSSLSLANTQEEFDEEINNLIKSINKYKDEGLLIGDIDPGKEIANYIATLNSDFSHNFTIEQGLTEKFGETLNKSLVQEFEKLSKNTQLKIVDLFDFSMDEEKGRKLLKTYQQFFESQGSVFGAIPVSFQDQLNDTVLKGKDISKGDWETLTSFSPSAENILGDKDSFNNKSIGERISLMQQLNEVIKESNLLAIKEYEINKANSEEIIKDLQNQKDAYIQEINILEKRIIEESYLSEEERENIKNRIKDIQTEIENLTNQQYEIEISLNMDEVTDNLVQGIIGDVMTSADQIKAATEAIGEGWTVAAEDVATFAAAFPELMEGMTRLEDGSLQLDKDIVNAAIESAQERIKANKTVAIEAAEDKIKQLKLELKFKEQQAKILDEALAGEKTAGETKAALAEALETYKEDLLDAGLISETDAINQAVDIEAQGVNNMIDVLGALNDAINTIHNNFANMLNVDAEIEDLKTGAAKASQVAQSAGVDRSKLYQNDFDDSSIDAMIEARQKLSGEISNIKTDIASYEGFVSEMANSVSEMDAAAERVKAGKAGKESKSKSGGSSKDKKDKEEKQYKEEFDRYWQLKKAIDAVDKALNKLSKDQENLYGYELIKSLKVENELLDQQRGYYEALAAAQNQEAEELRGQLGTMGVVFDASGAIVNYAEATANALAAYNQAIQQYNAGLIDETTLRVYEKSFENFKKLLDRYDTLYYQEMKDTQEKLDDIWREELANNLKAWEVEVQLKLDMKELKRGWNDFLTEIKQDFRKVYKDLRVETKNYLKDIKTYIGKNGTISTIIDAIHDVTGEIDKLRSGGSSDMFESISQAQEKLKELNQQLQDSARGMKELYENAFENLKAMIDQVADKFDFIQDRYDKINDSLDFQRKLIDLIYGKRGRALMEQYYETQEKLALSQVEDLRKERDLWKERFDNSGATLENWESWTEDQKKYYEEWQEAEEQLRETVLESIEKLQEAHEYAIQNIWDDLEKGVTNGLNFDLVEEEWERITDYTDKYYDDIQKAYKIQGLANKINESINNANSLKAQQKLQELREKEIGNLRTKEKLTQYDLDAANARLDIAQKEIALEEARNNKTSMKLTRNEQGNWSYQYIADEEDVSTKQQDLLTSYSNLYELALNANMKAQETYLEMEQKQIETLENLQEMRDKGIIDEETYEAEKLKIVEYYDEQRRLLNEEYEIARRDMISSGTMIVLEAYKQDEEAYATMTEEEKKLIDTLTREDIPKDYAELEDDLKNNYKNIGDASEAMMKATRIDWGSKAKEMMDLWNKDNGESVKAMVLAALKNIEKETKEYQIQLGELAKAADMDFGEKGISGSIKKAEAEVDNLKGKVDSLVADSNTRLNEMEGYLDKIAEAWRNIQDELVDSIRLIEEYLQYVGDVTAASIEAAAAIGAMGEAQAAVGGPSSGGGSSSGGSNPNQNSNNSGPEEYHKYRDGSVVVTDGEGNFIRMASEEEKKAKGLATGGYTGEWGDSSGRLAVLHQKEIVLNKDDTSNFLSGINLIRDMSAANNGSITDAITRSVANMIYELGQTKVGTNNIVSNNNTTSSNVDNNFYITAEFPNANSVDDIREAILNLPNIASQYIAENKK
jgi:TP901 family phage tail tape measure protein